MIIIFLLLFGILCFLLLSAYRFMRMPSNNPASYLKRARAVGVNSLPKIILIGDSITHGTVSANYVNIVESRLNPDPVRKEVVVINAGINGEFTYNVLQRLEPIIQCSPDVITILIGTNDAYGSLTPQRQNKKQRKWKLPELPTETTYQKHLTALVTQLREKTKARIALLSIPTIGEDSTTEEFSQSLRYSQIAKEVAQVTGVSYLPLNETMVAFLKEHPSDQKYSFKYYLFTIIKSILAHAFGKSWEKVARANGFQLHTDHLHLSPVGAAMVAGLIVNFYYRVT